jgi:hypothetical protein
MCYVVRRLRSNSNNLEASAPRLVEAGPKLRRHPERAGTEISRAAIFTQFNGASYRINIMPITADTHQSVFSVFACSRVADKQELVVRPTDIPYSPNSVATDTLQEPQQLP